MDLKIQVGDRERGSVPYESLPAFYYLFRDLGFQVHMDTENQKIQLNSRLAGKKISISSDQDPSIHSFRKNNLERNFLNHIEKFLSASGASVNLSENPESTEDADLHVKLALFEIPAIKEAAVLELTHNLMVNDQKLLEFFQYECKRSGVKFKANQLNLSGNSSLIKVHIMYPEIPDDLFWRKLGENFAIIMTMAILTLFQSNSGLSVLSLLPLDLLSNYLDNFKINEQTVVPLKKVEKKIPEDQNLAPSIPYIEKRIEAEAFFDYHLLIDDLESKKIKLLGNLHIKNTGTEILRNPVICLRSSPSESIKITGQILPPNIAKTRGIMSNEGTRGWQYMNEDWFEEVDKKGETWICPIQQMKIDPSQTESLSNFQISFLNLEEHKNIRIEAFVYFREQGLEIAANNRISLLFSEKNK